MEIKQSAKKNKKLSSFPSFAINIEKNKNEMKRTATASFEAPSKDSNSDNHQSGTEDMGSTYLYEIPTTQRNELCMLLDKGIWEQLAVAMGYEKKQIDVSIFYNFLFMAEFFIYFFGNE